VSSALQKLDGKKERAMQFEIYPESAGKTSAYHVETDSVWRAVEKWMEGKSEESLRNCTEEMIVEGEGDRIAFKVVGERGDFFAERMDGEKWEASR